MPEEVRTTSSTGGQKGVKAARYDLIPVPALDLLAKLYGRGAEKYEEHNWRKGYEWSKSYASALRHMTLFWDGEDIDPEMGIPHVICAAFHMFTLATFMIEHPEFDDRFRKDISNLYKQINEVLGEDESVEENDEGHKLCRCDHPQKEHNWTGDDHCLRMDCNCGLFTILKSDKKEN